MFSTNIFLQFGTILPLLQLPNNSPNNMVSVRAGRTDDLDVIMEIARELTKIMNAEGNLQWNEHYPTREKFLEDVHKGHLFVAVDEDVNNEVLGMAALNTDQAVEYGGVWNLNEEAVVAHRLGVSPKAQGKGVASLLLQHCETIAKEKNIPRIRVDTYSENVRMHHILEKKLGYEYKGKIQLNLEPKEIFSKLWFSCFEKFV
jgi:ribosomal protein S18 acetylase RimI-like enzyme